MVVSQTLENFEMQAAVMINTFMVDYGLVCARPSSRDVQRQSLLHHALRIFHAPEDKDVFTDGLESISDLRFELQLLVSRCRISIFAGRLRHISRPILLLETYGCGSRHRTVYSPTLHKYRRRSHFQVRSYSGTMAVEPVRLSHQDLPPGRGPFFETGVILTRP